MPFVKGEHHSVETRARMAKTRTGRHHSAAHCAAIGASLLGRVMPRHDARCSRCGDEFSAVPTQRFCSVSCRRRTRNAQPGQREKAAEWLREYRQTPAGRAYVRRMNLRSWGLTPEEYDAKLAGQGGVCAACGQVETARNQFGLLRLAIDHDHENGVLRGLLCMRCNRALGLLGDEPKRIELLLAYRRRFA